MWPERLSDHFTFAELIRSETAERLGIVNVPPIELLPNAQRLVALAERARAILCKAAGHDVKMIPSSGYRCNALNSRVGGSGANPGEKLSAHVMFRAMDFRTDGMSLPLAFDTLRRSGLDFDKLIWEIDSKGSSWIHLQVGRQGATPAQRVLRGVKLPGRSTFQEMARV